MLPVNPRWTWARCVEAIWSALAILALTVVLMIVGLAVFWSITVVIFGLTLMMTVVLLLLAIVLRYCLESITRLSPFALAQWVGRLVVWGGMAYLLMTVIKIFLASPDPLEVKLLLLIGFALGLVINDIRQFKALSRQLQPAN